MRLSNITDFNAVGVSGTSRTGIRQDLAIPCEHDYVANLCIDRGRGFRFNNSDFFFRYFFFVHQFRLTRFVNIHTPMVTNETMGFIQKVEDVNRTGYFNVRSLRMKSVFGGAFSLSFFIFSYACRVAKASAMESVLISSSRDSNSS